MQQHEEKKFVAPVLVGKVFPYAVVVKASDADGPGEYTAKGLMYENAQILIEYPFVKPGQSVESALADGAGAADHNQIDIHEAVLPDGSTLCRGESWEEAAHVPDWSSRIGAAVAVRPAGCGRGRWRSRSGISLSVIYRIARCSTNSVRSV